MKHYDFNKIQTDEINSSYLRKVACGDSLTIGKVEVKKGETTQMHSHDTEEVIVVLRGAWLFHLPEGDVTVTDDQVLCIPPGVEHSSEVLEDTIALDICSKHRPDWISGQDRVLHRNPEQFLWAV